MSAAAGFGVLALIGYSAGFRLNVSASAPAGVWRVDDVALPVSRGATVAICPPDIELVTRLRDAGHIAADWGVFRWIAPKACPSATVPFLKPVVAVEGDTVEVTRSAISVNGHPLRNSGSADLIFGIPAVKEGRYVVQRDQLWVVSSYTDHSFDSRYFGPLHQHDVRGIASPLVVRGDSAAIFSDRSSTHDRP